MNEGRIGVGAGGVLVLAGGGIDSTFCIHHFHVEGLKVRAFHIDFGQAAADLEWASVSQTASSLNIEATQLKITPPISRQKAEVSGRNAAFIALAFMHCRSDENLICIGVHAGTPFSDCSPSFVESMDRIVAEQCDSRVRVVAPLIRLLKTDVVRKAQDIGVAIMNTYSCQAGLVPACGSCHSCLDRRALGC